MREQNWLEQIENGVMPSALLASEVEKLHDDYSGNELANICLLYTSPSPRDRG